MFINHIETTVKNGFPIIFWYDLNPAEKDLGLPDNYIDDYKITTTKGKPCEWLKISEFEINKIIQSILEASND